ncbi:hypothetical protein IFM89_039844 [Coptis chinensis]|uniref:AAA+ ATPase domain-containing protein n=1 Tax=Coptis chinensis TaxID=261450 RepID=A0A835LC17_9MAGN|nr:hypothetical protein IFM89_039844 [Coptis chinensis]
MSDCMMFWQVGKSTLGVLWRRVLISPCTSEYFLLIINKLYPELEAVAKNLIEAYEGIRSSHSHQLGASQLFTRFSLRDLLKWCKRIQSLGFLGHSLSAHERKIIYVEELPSGFQIGRITLNWSRNVVHNQTRPFVDIPSSLHVLEKIACSVKHNEPVLLVGETGTGKTTLVQNLASRLGQPLTVLNLSQQSDVEDLSGGLKSTDPRFICIPLYNEFMELFPRTFSKTVNPGILEYLRKHRNDKNWKKILETLQKALQKVLDLTQRERRIAGAGKRKRPLSEEVFQAWERFTDKLNLAHRQINASSCMAFSFVEGAFITALRNGHWILLDEVNLAPPETLQRLMGVLVGGNGSLCLTERGDVDYIERHPAFRLFGYMNPDN